MAEQAHTGRIVGGRFELLDRLGSGGMGTVWRARDLGLEREVAIKEVRPADAAVYENDPSQAARQRERVLRESRALARLQHPNVVSIYQILEPEGSQYPWIVMELVRGMSLEDRLRHGPLPVPEVARIGRDVLGALRAAHSAGINHRDVKPANVLLRPDGSAVLTDFGIAALRDSTTLTATGEVIGSPEYIAPERLHGDETQTSSDLWSLAMLLYVAVEGYHPMRRSSTMATLAAVMTEPVPPPRRAGPLTPALTSCLVADPTTRPTGEQLDRMLASAESAMSAPSGGFPAVPMPFPATPPHGAPTGTPPPGTRAGTPPHGAPAAPSGGYPMPGTASYPVRRTGPSQPLPAERSGLRRVGVVAAFASVVVVSAVVALIISQAGRDDGGNNDAGGGGAGGSTTAPGYPGTVITVPSIVVPTNIGGGDTSGEDLLTPSAARKAVTELKKVMGGSRVTELILYPEYANATGPAKGVKNGFDDFEYRDGAATRKGPDGVTDQATLDLDKVNWDALPALANRAKNKLGIPKPTLRYLVISTDIIDGTPSMNYYLTDDYGGAYLKADLNGRVTQVYARDK
jgi:tRNA A-37 threonylcarbamoyl transferase component Bud32